MRGCRRRGLLPIVKTQPCGKHQYIFLCILVCCARARCMPCLDPRQASNPFSMFACTAQLWVGFVTWARGKASALPADVVDIRIRSLISQLEGLVAKRDQDISALSQTVRDARVDGKTAKSPVVQRNLKRILALKKSRASVMAHMHTLEVQLDCIESQSYNTQLVATMKASASTMRELGMSQSLQDADQALASLSENMDTAGEITSALAVPLTDSIDDDELDAEFDAIMAEHDSGLSATATRAITLTLPSMPANSMIVPNAASAARATPLVAVVEELPQPAAANDAPLVDVAM